MVGRENGFQNERLRGWAARLGVLGQQRAEVVLEEVLHLLVQRGAVLEQLLQLVDGELARGASAAAV